MKMLTRIKPILALALALLVFVTLIPARANAVEPDMNISINWEGVSDNTNLPASLTLDLIQSGPLGTKTTYRTATLTRPSAFSSTWTGKFSEVPRTTIGGTPYSYSIVWPAVTGFSIVASQSITYGTTASAVYTYSSTIPDYYDVTVNWSGEPTSSYTRPVTSLAVQLMNAKTATVNHPSINITGSGDTWFDSFSGITGVVSAGAVVNAQVVSPPSGYTVSYTFVAPNSFNIDMTYNSDFTGTITWLNAPRFNKPGLTIKVGVDGTTANDRQICFGRTDEDCLSYTVSGLDPDLTYVLKSVTIDDTIADDLNYSSPTWNGRNITISRKWNPLFRIGVSMRWIDNYNKREHRPIETTIYLYRDGVFTGDEAQIREADGWDAYFYDQPYSDGAHVYSYSVRAHKIPYYWSRCTRLSNFGFLVTQFYGNKSYDQPATSSAAPKVGDPTLFRTELTDLMRHEATSSAGAIAALAGAADSADTAEPAAVDFDTLKRINKDVVAWVSLADTPIDYPIVHGSNNTKYLSRLFTGEANSAGSIFMDYHNSGKFTNKNTIIYGHNMQDGTMFNALLSYRDQSFYAKNKSISLQTPYGEYSLEPVAGFFTKEAYSNVAKRTFNNNTAFLSYVDKCIDSSDFQSATSVAATDKLVTFVTCSDDYNDGTRYLLVCKLTALD